MSRSPALDEDQREAVRALAAAERVLLASHVRPDGDGIGAQAALAGVLRGLGKAVAIVNPDPPSRRFDFFTAGLGFTAWNGAGLPEHDLCVLLDISELERCGQLGLALRAHGARKLVVDHHIHRGDRWWDHAFVDVSASATGLLVHRIARALDAPLDRTAATAVFVSLASDTGWFKYSNTDAETMGAAAELVDLGVDPSEVYRALHQREPAGQPAWLAALLARTAYRAGGRLAVVDQPLEAGVGEGVDSDLALDVLRSVEQVEVVVFLRELPDGSCKASLRSKTEFDVNAVARRLGGGGHRKASGLTLPGPFAESGRRVVQAVLEDLGGDGGAA